MSETSYISPDMADMADMGIMPCNATVSTDSDGKVWFHVTQTKWRGGALLSVPLAALLRCVAENVA